MVHTMLFPMKVPAPQTSRSLGLLVKMKEKSMFFFYKHWVKKNLVNKARKMHSIPLLASNC